MKKLEDSTVHREERADFFLNTHFEGAWSNTAGTGRSIGRRQVPPLSLVVGKCAHDPHTPILYATLFPMRRRVGLPPPIRLLHLGRRLSTSLPTHLVSLFGIWICYFWCFLCSVANLFPGFLDFFNDCLIQWHQRGCFEVCRAKFHSGVELSVE